ncbi:MAG: Ig-like domain-containing protein [Planctomycetota bacterium]
MKRVFRTAVLPPVALIVPLVLGLAAACSDGSGRRGSAGTPGLAGVVFDYTGNPARGESVTLDPATGGPLTGVGPDGRFFVAPVSQGAHVLRFGDSVKTPRFFVPVVVNESSSYLAEPVFLPLLESGIKASVPPTVGFAITVAGPELGDVSLAINSATAVTYPANAPQAITVVGVAPSRLPVRLPSGLATKAAYCVEPRGVEFLPGATLTVPRLENSPTGWDLWKLGDDGAWTLAIAMTDTGQGTLTAVIEDGSLYAPVPRTPPTTINLTGRVTSGARAIAGYRVSCWGQVSLPTGTDGRFTIPSVPLSYGGFLVRVYPARPGVDFAPEVVTLLATANGQDVGDLAVVAQAPITVRPKVLSTQPTDKQIDIPLQTQVGIQFSGAIDPLSLDVKVTGLLGAVPGRTFLTNAFTAVFVPTGNLRPAETYSIVVDPDTTDLAGNFVDDTKLLFKFTTQNVPPPPPPTDQKIFGLSPIIGTGQTEVTLPGRNYPGGSAVKVGGTNGIVRQETATEIQFLPPLLEPAGDLAVSVINSANTTVSSIGPLVLDLRSSISALSTGTIVRSTAGAAVFVTGANVANGTVVADGLSIASVNSIEVFGGIQGITGRQVTVAPTAASLFTGPVVVRGGNGKNGLTYRFIQVADR